MCQALGLKASEVVRIDIHVPAGGIFSATVEMLLTEKTTESLTTIIKKYELVEKR